MTRRPFPLAVPTELRPYILDFHWDLELLHALDLPAVSLQVADLADHLDLPFWAYDGRPFQLTPHQVAERRPIASLGAPDQLEVELTVVVRVGRHSLVSSAVWPPHRCRRAAPCVIAHFASHGGR